MSDYPARPYPRNYPASDDVGESGIPLKRSLMRCSQCDKGMMYDIYEIAISRVGSGSKLHERHAGRIAYVCSLCMNKITEKLTGSSHPYDDV